MMEKRERLRLRATFMALAMILGLTASLVSGRFAAVTLARPHTLSPSLPSALECGGDACSQVAFDFDETKQQYRAHNNSQDRWIKVSASNLASSASVCLAPGKEQYLALKSIIGSYSADFAEVKCGETMD